MEHALNKYVRYVLIFQDIEKVGEIPNEIFSLVITETIANFGVSMRNYVRRAF